MFCPKVVFSWLRCVFTPVRSPVVKNWTLFPHEMGFKCSQVIWLIFIHIWHHMLRCEGVGKGHVLHDLPSLPLWVGGLALSTLQGGYVGVLALGWNVVLYIFFFANFPVNSCRLDPAAAKTCWQLTGALFLGLIQTVSTYWHVIDLEEDGGPLPVRSLFTLKLQLKTRKDVWTGWCVYWGSYIL